MSKETIKAKLAGAVGTRTTRNTGTTTIQHSTVKVLNPINVLNRYGAFGESSNYKDFKSEVFNLTETLKEKLQFLTFGKPIIVNYEGEDFKTQDLLDRSNLQETMFASEGDLFDKYRSHVIIEKIGDNIITRLADPNFPNKVLRIAGIPYMAVIWSQFKVDVANYWMKTTYTESKITNEVYTGESFKQLKKSPISNRQLRKLNKTIGDKNLQIHSEMVNQFSFLPIEEITYKPTRDYSWSAMDKMSLRHRLEPKQKMLNEATFALRRELYINHSRTLIDADLVDDLNKDQINTLAEKGILAVLNDSGNHDGDGKAIETIMGDPKVTSYWENITNIISLAVRDLKLSELQESEGGGTATEAIFSKGNDVELVNTLSTYRQKSIARILEKMRAMKEGESFAESEIDITKWGVQIVPNVIMNEAKMTDIVIAQLGAGLINMVQAKVKLENISKEAAENSLNESEEYHNPTLEATSAFGGDNPNDPNNKNTDTNDPTNGENKQTPEAKK